MELLHVWTSLNRGPLRSSERHGRYHTRDTEVRPSAPGSKNAQRGQHDREVAVRVLREQVQIERMLASPLRKR